MATSDLIQYLETEQFSALPGGAPEAVGVATLNRRKVETFVATGPIAIGQVVSLDASQTGDGDKGIKVSLGDTGSNDTVFAVGVALTAAAASGDKVDVCIRGICEAQVDANALKGNALYLTGTAGQLDDVAPAAPLSESVPVAQCMEDKGAGAGLTTVFVIGRF
jgi:hypothetical protein